MGLRPGQRHSGQFVKNDPRAYRGGRKAMLVPGTNKTLPELCRLKTKEALDVLCELLVDDRVSHDVRRKCADSLLDRGWGKPEQAVKVEQDGQGKVDPSKMTTADLMAMVMERQEEQRLQERTLEGELESPETTQS